MPLHQKPFLRTRWFETGGQRTDIAVAQKMCGPVGDSVAST